MLVPPSMLSVSPFSTVWLPPVSPATVIAVAIAAVVTPVTRPLALTVTTGIAVTLPKLPTSVLTVASVVANVTSCEPSKLTVEVASPLIPIALVVANVVAVVELPTNAPVNEVALTFSEPKSHSVPAAV